MEGQFITFIFFLVTPAYTITDLFGSKTATRVSRDRFGSCNQELRVSTLKKTNKFRQGLAVKECNPGTHVPTHPWEGVWGDSHVSWLSRGLCVCVRVRVCGGGIYVGRPGYNGRGARAASSFVKPACGGCGFQNEPRSQAAVSSSDSCQRLPLEKAPL
uniref:Uncharacterized protein n=1 Tax=Sphaerodactylus townsendi TaxID=933632 RepID=A0ACB8F847_9SAUR